MGKTKVLTDKFFIENCTNKFPKFLTPSLKKRLNTLFEGIDGDDNISPEKVDSIESIWNDLLNDAITFLKFNDKREYDYKSKEDGIRRYGGGKVAAYKRDQVAFGADHLSEYFTEFQEFEALLYGADKIYRDHILHVFRVWMIGIWLIEQFKFNLHWDFADLGIKEKALFISDNEILAMWCIVALTHDLGYPLDKVKKVKAKINGMMSYFGGNGVSEGDFQIPTHHHFINDFILKFISSKLIEIPKNKQFETAIQTKFYLKFSKSFEKFDHGIISCVVLMKNLIYFLESDFDLSNPFKDPEDARQYCIRREILRAIACHTCTDIYHLHPDALSFILILADELQTWARPTFTELKSGKKIIEISVAPPQISREKITIKMKTQESNEKAAKEHFIQIYKKWHKWLRGALDGKDRTFVFELCFSTTSRAGDQYKFLSKPGNKVEYYINEKKRKIRELYKKT